MVDFKKCMHVEHHGAILRMIFSNKRVVCGTYNKGYQSIGLYVFMFL
jgi:hypothetical protein